MKKVLVLGLAVFLMNLNGVFGENIPRATIVGDDGQAVIVGKALPAGVAVLGPKKMLAVAAFENKTNWYGNWNLGEGMAEQLTTALMKTGNFIVLERQNIDDVLKEQDFGASGRTTAEGGAKMGQIYKSQILIRGAVTEFDNKKSDGQGIRIQNVTLGGSSAEAKVAVDVRVYDTTTGQVLASKMCQGIARNSSTTFSFANADYGFGSTQFNSTPIGEATREAIEGAVDFIIREMANVPWQGKVVMLKDDKLYINTGENAGIKIGDKFVVYGVGETLVDPDTGMNLGSEETKLGEIQIYETAEKFSKASILSGQGFKRGDVIKFE